MDFFFSVRGHMTNFENHKSVRVNIFVMGLSILALVALSYFRFAITGSPSVDEIRLELKWDLFRRVVTFLSFFAMGVSFLKLVSAKQSPSELTSLFIFSVLLQLVAAVALPLTSNDIFSNLAYGKMAALQIDADLYGVTSLSADDVFRKMVTARWLETPMVYGPVAGWLNRLLTWPESLWTSVVSYKIFILLVSLVITAVAYAFCKVGVKEEDRSLCFVLFALNPVFIWEFASQAHNDAVMVLGIACFVLFASMKKYWAALACLLFAFVTKLAVLPVLALYLFFTFFDSKRRFAFFCIALAAFGLISAVYFYDKIAYVLVVPSSDEVDWSRLTNTPLYLLYRILKPAGTHVQLLGYKVYWIAAMIFMAGLGLRFALNCKTKDDLFRYSFLFLFLFNLIASPSYQTWYVTWLIPFACAVSDAPLRRFFAAYSVVAILQYFAENSLFGSILNLGVLGAFWLYYLRKNRGRLVLRGSQENLI